MYFLGIDQSLNGTGLCRLLEGGGVDHLETVCPGKLRGVERLAHIKSKTATLLYPSVKFAAIEHYSYNSVGRVFELGEVGGVLRLLVYEYGVPFVVVPPTSLKKFATGNAAADKAAMVAAAKKEGANVADDNQADAFFLAMIAKFFHTGAVATTRARLEVLQTLKSPKTKKPSHRARQLVKNAI